VSNNDGRPWEVIRAAADRLVELAGQATVGPWHGFAGEVSSVPPPGHERVCSVSLRGDQHWIATLSPAVAEPLVAWLWETAAAAEHHVPIWETTHPSGRTGPGRTAEQVAELVRHHFGHPLALSRAILGGQP
jgi:hypothetical protein